MERSSKHGPRVDDEMNRAVRSVVQGSTEARAEERLMAEPAGEDQPDPMSVPEGDGGTGAPRGGSSIELEQFSRFGRYIGPAALPGDRRALRASAQTLGAPDDVMEELDRLPKGVTYETVAQIWAGLGHKV